MNIDDLLQAFRDGIKSIEEVKEQLNNSHLKEMEDVVIDLQREVRCGLPEVVYGRTKTVQQILDGAKIILAQSEKLLITRVNAEKAEEILKELPQCTYCSKGEVIYKLPPQTLKGKVLVIGAGTSDAKVVTEAAITVQMFGVAVEQLVDVGVAGLHRLLKQTQKLQTADCIIICAGMEGALPSVVGGLVKVPVIAVPVSSGYGMSLGGVSALLGMLNSCASGLTVVNVDNGFGAGYAAGRIMLLQQKGFAS